MPIRIAHPRPLLGRQLFLSTEFIDGIAEVGELHPELEAALLQHGATIEKELAVEAVALETLTARELRDLAGTENIELPGRATKAEIIAILNEAPLPTLTESGEFLAAQIVPLTPGEE